MYELNIIIASIAALMLLSGFYFLFDIKLCKSDKKAFEAKASIIIPARNEEQNIAKLLDSIFPQIGDNIEVIVVNDASTDRTKEICIQKGVNVLDSKPLPEGWNGKPWACFQGAQAAKHNIMIFLDADTEIELGGLEKLLDTYLSGCGVMSVAPFHKVKDFYEEFSAVFNIIMMGSMNAFTPIKRAAPHGLFGQSLILSKAEYSSIGGHEAVKDKVLENMFMAKQFIGKGHKLRCYGGAGSISFRMYPDGLRELINGWSKAFASGAAEIPLASLLNIILWISGGLMAAAMLIYSAISNVYLYFWFTFYLLFSIQFMWMIKRIGSFKILSAFLFPLHLVFFCFVFSRSLYFKVFNIKPKWKSREVTA